MVLTIVQRPAQQAQDTISNVDNWQSVELVDLQQQPQRESISNMQQRALTLQHPATQGPSQGRVCVTITNDGTTAESFHAINSNSQKRSWIVRKILENRARIKTMATAAISAGFGAVFYWLLEIAGMEGDANCVTSIANSTR